MDAPSFSAVMEQLAAQVPFFRPEDYPTCASAAGVCRLAAAIASACPVTCNDPCATGSKEPIDVCEPPASVPASDFSLDTYISAPWFVQESVPKPYNRQYSRGKRELLTYWRPAYCTTAQCEMSLHLYNPTPRALLDANPTLTPSPSSAHSSPTTLALALP